MSSPPLSRSSSPSLESVSDISGVESPSPEFPVQNPVLTVDVSGGTSLVNGEVTVACELRKDDTHESASHSVSTEEKQGPAEQSIGSLGAKHERYFFTADFFTFAVIEETLYRVHSDFFTRFSPYWAKKVANDACSSDIIRLDDVHKNEMDAFLSTLYPTSESETKSRTLEDWAAILRLSTTWQFAEKRKLAITALDALAPPLEKLRLARAYDVESWIHPSFVSLCIRPKTLSLQEAERLSLQDVMCIVSTREALFQGRAPSQNDAAQYIAKHVHAPISPLPIKVPVAPPVKPPVCNVFADKPLPKLSTKPSIEEKQAFAELFTSYQYSQALAAVETQNIQAFCGLLADFSTVYQHNASFNIFSMSVIKRGVSDPSFIPLGTQLLKTIIVALPFLPASKWSNELTIIKAKSTITSYYDYAQKFWKGVDEAIVKHGDFTLAMSQATLSTPGQQTFMILDLMPTFDRVCESAYEQRSASLRAFFAALGAAGLLKK